MYRLHTLHHARQHETRGGVTLIELIVVVSIIVILVAITATAIRVNYDSDRIRAGARQMQSYLLGARDRAIHAKAPRGVRLLMDPDVPNIVTSMVYIQPTEIEPYNVYIYGADRTQDISGVNPAIRVELPISGGGERAVPDWVSLANQKLLWPRQLRIRIPADGRGEWYVVNEIRFDNVILDPDVGPTNSGSNSQVLILSSEYRQPVDGRRVYTTAQLELPPSVLANEQPVQLPRGICVDLGRCSQWVPYGSGVAREFKVPRDWYAGRSPVVGPVAFTDRFDILFSPRGYVIGPSAATGVIQLYLTEQYAAEANLDPSYVTGDLPVPDNIVTTIFTRTGSVVTSPVNKVDAVNNGTAAAGGDGLADDPFYYSERGEVAGR